MVRRSGRFTTPMGKTVLLVDDDAAVRRLVARLLGRHGYTAIQCESVREAIALVTSPGVAFETVLTDLVMPDGDGAELASQVARCRPNTPVILMSGYALDDLHPNERPKACQMFLQKPFSREELFQAIDEAHRAAAA